MVAFIFFLLELFAPQILVEICYEIIAIFSSLGFISFFAEIIIDFIFFIAFYFYLEETILNALFLSFGNLIGDLFGYVALAKVG